MKIIFLDIDGVLNSRRSAYGLGGMPHRLDRDHLRLFDPVAVGLIRNLCTETVAQIVLSSSWRILHKWAAVGSALNLPIIGETPRGSFMRTASGFEIEIGQTRGHEIAAWMQANGTPDSYAIVDDDSDMLPEQMPYFVKTSHDEGLLYAQYEALLKLLSPEHGLDHD